MTAPFDPTRPVSAPPPPATSSATRAPRPPIAAVALRPTATLRAGSTPSRADMAACSTVTVSSWDDALLDRFGHDPRSPYVERYWLGVLGPSATWLLRAFAHRFDAEPDGYVIDLRDTARSLGIGARGGANGALVRTLERVVAFGFARFTDDTHLAVRRRMGPLNRRQQQRLTPQLQREHDTWLAEHPTTTPSVDDVRRRARALALSLIELGEDATAAEHQLHRWRFHPAVAFDSVRWATEIHAHRVAQRDGAPDPLAGGSDAA